MLRCADSLAEKFFTQWDPNTKQFFIQFHFKLSPEQQAALNMRHQNAVPMMHMPHANPLNPYA
jgi:hypothetical protein